MTSQNLFSLHHHDPAKDADPQVRRLLDAFRDAIHDDAMAEVNRRTMETLLYGRASWFEPDREPSP